MSLLCETTDMTIQFSFWSNLWLKSVSFSDHLCQIGKDFLVLSTSRKFDFGVNFKYKHAYKGTYQVWIAGHELLWQIHVLPKNTGVFETSYRRLSNVSFILSTQKKKQNVLSRGHCLRLSVGISSTCLKSTSMFSRHFHVQCNPAASFFPKVGYMGQ